MRATNPRGILQADGCKGYAKLYEPDGVPRLRGKEDRWAFRGKDRPTNACWAHLRRDFHGFWTSTKSQIAREALDRIGKLYDIERDSEPMCAIGSSTMASGQSADVRHAARQKLSQPKATAFFAWSEQQLLRIPGKSEQAKTFR